MTMWTTSLLLFSALVGAIAGELLAPLAITDLRVVVADSEQSALSQCHASSNGSTSYVPVGVDWTMGVSPSSSRFVQLCKQRQRLDATYTGDVVQRIRILNSTTCPVSSSTTTTPSSATWTRLHEPRKGVIVCVLKTSAQNAKRHGEFVADIDVTRTKFYNDALPEWTTLRDTSVHEARESSNTKPNTGVYLSARRPLSRITSLSVVALTSADPTTSATVCGGDAEDVGVIQAPASGGNHRALCVTRAIATESENGDALVNARVVRVLDECDATANKTEFTPELSLCLSWSSHNSTAGNVSFISELRVERWSPENGSPLSEVNVTTETKRFIAAIEKSGFELVQTPTPLEPSSATSPSSVPFLFLRRAHTAPNFTTKTEPPTTRPPLTARRLENGSLTFKILQLADLHYSGDASTACRNPPHTQCTEATMTRFVAELLDREKPDFAVLTGDNVQMETRNDSFHAAAMDAAMAQLEQRSVPYALIFGNHDDENGFSRDELIRRAMAKPHSYTQRGPAQVDGVGNYQLSVQAPSDGTWGSNGSDVFRMYFLDSHAYPDAAQYPMVESTYDWIKPSQVQYFHQLTNSLTRVPAAVMFFHIPLPEYAAAPTDNKPPLVSGARHEAISSATVNSHLFSALTDQQQVKATFIGHDHVNDYCYKREGIQLCYGGGAGFGQAYGDAAVPRRARVIEWSVDAQGLGQIKTWKRLHGKIADKRDVELLYSQSPDPEIVVPSTSLVLLYCGIAVVLSMLLTVLVWMWWRSRKGSNYAPVRAKTTTPVAVGATVESVAQDPRTHAATTTTTAAEATEVAVVVQISPTALGRDI